MIKFMKVKDVLKNYTEVYCEEYQIKSIDATTLGNAKYLHIILGNKRIRDLSRADIKNYKTKRLRKEKVSNGQAGAVNFLKSTKRSD